MTKTKKKHELQPGEVVHRTKAQEIWLQFVRNKGAVVALIFLVLLLGVLIFAQFYFDFEEDICALSSEILAKPSWEHPCGTDQLGRDVFARLLYGGRWSISLACASICISTIIGIVIGAIATYAGGWVEIIMMRTIESIMMIPTLLMVIVLVSVLGISTVNLLMAMSIGGIPFVARLTRSLIMPIRDVDYVEAARAIAVSDGRILFTHILPNCASPLIVNVTTRIGNSIVLVSTYSFLGLGVPKPIPEWGTMLSEARSFMAVRPDLIFYPGLMILLFALAFNLMGDGLRDALDPKLKR